MADNANITPGTGLVIATDEVGSVHYQKVKLISSIDDSTASIGISSNPLYVSVPKSSSTTITQVASSASNTTLKAANAARLGLSVHNASTANLYMKFGLIASLTSYSVKLSSDSYYELPYTYTGIIEGIWATASGYAYVTEFI
jgi:hypothetical protein